MRKTVVFSSLFLLAFGLAMGLTAFSTSASAGIPCPENCIYELYCSTDTGPLCTNPNFPYYGYKMNGWCTTGNPHHFCLEDGDFSYCCRDFPW